MENLEKLTSKKSSGKGISRMTLQQAIELGEYDPDFLATFPEWHTFSPHVRLQYIRQGLDNRKKQLTLQWAEINNVLDFRLKPELQTALRNIEKQIKKLETDREKIYLDYSEKI
jgi:hypothetical protein